MALRTYPILSLRQLAMLKLATKVYDDPEIVDFVQNNGCVSFVFPSEETLMYMKEEEDEVEQTWTRKDFLREGVIIKAVKSNLKLKMAFPEDESSCDTLPFQRWEELVEKKISFLLPQCLLPELFEIIRSVSMEIDKWIKDLSLLLKRSAEIAYTAQRYFQWNSLGNINRVETARMLIRNGAATIEDLYVLALHYDLMDDMLMDENRRIACNRIAENYVDFLSGETARELWETSAGESGLYHFSQQYFFTELIPERRVTFLTSLMMTHRLSYEDLLFCLSRMQFEERKEILEKRHFYILRFFLSWPLQCQFLDAAKLLLPYFEPRNLSDILAIILYERIMLGRKDFNYVRLLKEFWTECSPQLKEFIERDPIYKPLVFTIDYPNEETFPNKHLLTFDFGNGLYFRYWGIKYCLFKRKLVQTKEASYTFYQDPLFPAEPLPNEQLLESRFGNVIFTRNQPYISEINGTFYSDNRYVQLFVFIADRKRKRDDLEHTE